MTSRAGVFLSWARGMTFQTFRAGPAELCGAGEGGRVSLRPKSRSNFGIGNGSKTFVFSKGDDISILQSTGLPELERG